MKFCSLSSGSDGNCQYIETEKVRIIIDAGFSGKQVESLLKEIEVNPHDLDAIFVTHEHIDHIKGIGVLSRRFDIPVYANEGTWIGMEKTVKEIKPHNIRVFNSNKSLELKDLLIHPFSTLHDANDPVGYIAISDNKKITILTDSGMIEKEVFSKIKNSQLYFIEANHDVQMLLEGSYPLSLKKRIMSSHGHLSNEDCANALGELLRGEREKVLLAHLSKDNNIPALALNTVKAKLMALGYDLNEDVLLGLTSRNQRTALINL